MEGVCVTVGVSEHVRDDEGLSVCVTDAVWLGEAAALGVSVEEFEDDELQL
jgi:hypothetical protein